MIEKNSGKPYMNVIFGNFYSPGYDDPDFVDETMELIKNDIIKVISKYMEIDPEGLDIQITQSSEESEGPALYANIPIRELRK